MALAQLAVLPLPTLAESLVETPLWAAESLLETPPWAAESLVETPPWRFSQPLEWPLSASTGCESRQKRPLRLEQPSSLGQPLLRWALRELAPPLCPSQLADP